MKKRSLSEEITALPFHDITSEKVSKAFLTHVQGKKIIMDENPEHHFCVYTLPYHPETKKILIGHHIKADKWIVPGGHIDPGETIKQTAMREISEELAHKIPEEAISAPFFLSITHITNTKPPRKCKTHFDIWIYFLTPNTQAELDASEFHTNKWVSLNEAIELTTDQANKEALEKFSAMKRTIKN